MMPRNPMEADWLIRSAEEEAARAERRAAIAQQHAAYQVAVAKAHVADAAGLRALWNFVSPPLPRAAPPVDVEAPPAELVEEPKCEYCGKPTRIWHGKPQRFCSFPKDRPGYSCATRFRDRRNWELKKSAAAKARATVPSGVSCVEIDADPPQDPVCQQCGKVTRIWHGKRQKFCSPPAGRHVSPCASAFHDLARRAGSTRRATRGPQRPASLARAGDRFAETRQRAVSYYDLQIERATPEARGAIEAEKAQALGKLDAAYKQVAATARKSASDRVSADGGGSGADAYDNALSRALDQIKELELQAQTAGKATEEVIALTEANRLRRAADAAGRLGDAGVAEEIDKVSRALPPPRRGADGQLVLRR